MDDGREGFAGGRPRKEPGVDAQMARRLAHELRSPVGVIRGGLDEVLGRDDVPADALAFLAVARRATARLQRLAERLEWIARIESDGPVMPRGEDVLPVSLQPLMERAIGDARAHTRRSHIEVTLEIASELAGRSTVLGPALARVVEELVDDAIRRALRTVAIAVEGSDGELVLRIEHDGVPPATEGGLGREELDVRLGRWLVHALAERLGIGVGVEGARVTLTVGGGPTGDG